MATFDDFMKLDIRAGTIVSVKVFEKARKPAYQLEVDFGDEIGVKKSSAQITEVYKENGYLQLEKGIIIEKVLTFRGK